MRLLSSSLDHFEAREYWNSEASVSVDGLVHPLVSLLFAHFYVSFLPTIQRSMTLFDRIRQIKFLGMMQDSESRTTGLNRIQELSDLDLSRELI